MITNEEPEDARALWIIFKGREWVVMFHGDHFTAFASDNKKVTKRQLNNLFNYLTTEGFINRPPNQPPNQYQTV